MPNTYYLQQFDGTTVVNPRNLPPKIVLPNAFTPGRDAQTGSPILPPENYLVEVTADSYISNIFAGVQATDHANPEEPLWDETASTHTLRLFRKRNGVPDVEIVIIAGGIIIPKPDTTLPIIDRMQVNIKGGGTTHIADLKAHDQLYITVTNNIVWGNIDDKFARIYFACTCLPATAAE
jgi:hypothetical protein